MGKALGKSYLDGTVPLTRELSLVGHNYYLPVLLGSNWSTGSTASGGHSWSVNTVPCNQQEKDPYLLLTEVGTLDLKLVPARLGPSENQRRVTVDSCMCY